MSLTKSFGTEKWLVLVVSLPTANTALRMRMWRGLKALGCAVLRDGVYLLPAGRGLRQTLKVYGEEIRQGGGDAYLLNVSVSAGEERQDFRALFDRSGEYASLMDRVDAFRSACAGLEPAVGRRQLKQLRRDLAALTAVDYFPGLKRVQAEDFLTEVETAYLASLMPGEPRDDAGAQIRCVRTNYQGRLWATRKNLWVDRLASAWLIRRFIDPDARFLWLERVEDCPSEAVGFDFDGAEFSHGGQRVTVESLLFAFSLEEDQALARLGQLVHYLDVGGMPPPEAAGIEMVLKGLRHACTDDDALMAEAQRVFDGLYLNYEEELSNE